MARGQADWIGDVGHIYHIGIGSNLDDPAARVVEAITRLAGTGTVLARSSLYRTAPWGHVDQPWFVNAVVKVESDREPGPMLEAMQAIETGLGRVETFRWGPRRIDLDLLLAGDRVVEGGVLRIPHPSLHKRAFVLVPLIEIEGPELVPPSLDRPLRDWLEALPATEREDVQILKHPAHDAT